MIFIYVFLNVYCKMWLNEEHKQQWQNESISQDFTGMEESARMYKGRVPFVGKYHISVPGTQYFRL